MRSFEYPARRSLARLPTPLEPLPATGAMLGVDLWIKRDDLTGVEMTGNKVRKLEFLLADALAKGADTLITCGGEQSNHCRATAFAARQAGMDALLLLRTRDPEQPPPARGNILLDRLVGAEIQWIDHQTYGNRAQRMAAEAERLRSAGRTPYIIPEGGSNEIGSWGYVAAIEELAEALVALPPKPTTIVYACGSGGTGAGLLLGARLFGLDRQGLRLSGVNVCNDRDYFVSAISAICAAFDERFGVAAGIESGDIDIVDGYVGAGYGQSRPEELAALRELARREGVVLDPVYTGKAFYGMCQELARDRARFGERVIFLHTGGIFGLLAQAEALAEVL
ncbi:D-cysteine desulfhydrase family protein [Haliangium ochraceum]|uniref:Pyridoxal phosphate-dependent enzyme, D-cysteine desulfhydrase family n=1 Tax=Haliangium ochraceum (strain DSM 14365 / JCM 11303 / SMP-2) TaxID=502025 RepID=D0LXJ6_HALO1|nr:D-cysteine desulfhydrase family protein [Haliangium ochraceum]ACY17751.1 pyridoxal phosphate-dependent enzyme, D- cysteine desulfhydrase family [Haliangium ochraceum DSM 14365]